MASDATPPLVQHDLKAVPMKSRAFTIIELLVTVSIAALLLTLLLPALFKGRESASQVQCMTGLRQLSIGYFSYSGDNDWNLMFGQPANRIDAFVYPGAGLEPIKKGALFPYVNRPDYYQCPDDPNGNERSYSLPGTLYGEGWNNGQTQGTDTYDTILSPSAQIVWFEESDNRGWNVGSWIIRCARGSEYSWIDYVGLMHHEETADNFGFLDGHVETRIWEDGRVVENARKAKDEGFWGFNKRFPDSSDWDWVRPRYRQLPTQGNVDYLPLVN